MKLWLLTLLAVWLTSPCPAKTRITGTVKDRQGKPVEAVLVKLVANDVLAAYTTTGADGTYRMDYAGSAARMEIRFEHLSFRTFSQTVDNRSQTLDVILESQSIRLKEVTVRAPLITQQGDTLSYRLSAFAGQGDVTLKDAMRKIPGIDIARSGKISYLGKDISHFYIEGLDLLGGRYNIATNNIPAQYVNTVQVLNNHQDVKMEKDVFSDQVAINVTLNPKAKLRPVGTYRAATGYGDEWLYQLSGAGMLFKPDFQSILTLQLGNLREFEADERRNLLADEPAGAAPHDLLGDLGTSSPPLERERHIRPDERSLSLNLLGKPRRDATVKTHLGYGYARATYGFSTLRQYYQGAADVVMEQVQEPLSHTHSPSLETEYRYNGETRYLTNKFAASASFRDNRLPTRTGNSSLAQAQSVRDYSLRNTFNVRWKQGKMRWNLASTLQYAANPSGCLTVTGASVADFRQTARNYRFFTRETVSGSYTFRHSRLYFPLTFQASTERIHTVLASTDAPMKNRVSGWNGQLAFSPQYEYTHPLRRFVFRGGLDVKGTYYDFKNSGSVPASDRHFHFHLNPDLYFHYRMNAQSTLTAQLSYRQQTGDVLDMLTAPIQTDYLSRSVRSGLLSEARDLSANLHYDFKIPLEMWFLNADVRFNRTWHNLMSGQEVSTDLITLTQFLLPHHSDRLTASTGVTKQIVSIRTKLSLQASYAWNRNVIRQDEAVIPYDGQNIALSPQLNARPWDFLELDYQGSFSRTFSRYLNSRRSYAAQTHRLKLSAFPVPACETTLSTDITHREISDGHYKTLALFDAGVYYSFKSFRIGIDVHNLLDQRLYAYTVFSGLDKFTYQYRLRGREYLVSFTFTR